LPDILENVLDDLLGCLAVAGDPQRDRIDKPPIAIVQLAERALLPPDHQRQQLFIAQSRQIFDGAGFYFAHRIVRRRLSRSGRGAVPCMSNHDDSVDRVRFLAGRIITWSKGLNARATARQHARTWEITELAERLNQGDQHR
jgi:hypothetical protein